METIVELRVVSYLKVVLEKYRKMTPIDIFWFIILVSTVTPIIEFLIIRADSFLSNWILLAILYSVLAVYAEVYYANYLIKTHWWRDKVIIWWRRLTNSEKVSNMETKNHIADIIRRLEYLGLFLATAAYFFGKPAVIVYTENKKKLPYGFLFLVLGWWARLIWEYHSIKALTFFLYP